MIERRRHDTCGNEVNKDFSVTTFLRNDKMEEWERGLFFRAVLTPEHVGEGSKKYGCEGARP
jgi:hypothetical protein